MRGRGMQAASFFVLLLVARPATAQTPHTGVVDVNRDGQLDLLWQHYADGRLGVWDMNGVEILTAALLERSVSANVDWRIVGVK